MLSYKESESGQIMHTGINEAGSAAVFQAVGTSYATHGEPLVPFYIFYSMFGFQRTGDQFWAAGDQMTRGFIVGATAGRTTLTGEGLQHADGHSPLLAQTNPAVVHYDPAYGYEIRHIVRDGLNRMYGEDDPRDPNVMYYLTVYNEPMPQPAEPEDVDVEGILRGLHRIHRPGRGPRAQLLASGVGVPWALEAAELLAEDWGVHADVWSVTSWNELRRDGVAADEHNFLHPGGGAASPTSPRSSATPRDRSSRRPTTTTWSPTRCASGSPATTRCSAPTGSASPTPGPRLAGSSRSTDRRWWSAAPDARGPRRGRPRRPSQAIEKYRLHDVRAGTSGMAGGDS